MEAAWGFWERAMETAWEFWDWGKRRGSEVGGGGGGGSREGR